MSEDIVRILRIIEYKGLRSWVQKTLDNSIQGTKQFPDSATITAVTLGNFPEILQVTVPSEESQS